LVVHLSGQSQDALTEESVGQLVPVREWFGGRHAASLTPDGREPAVRLLTADGPVVPADQSPADRTALITTATRTASSRITSRTGPSSSTSTIRTASPI